MPVTTQPGYLAIRLPVASLTDPESYATLVLERDGQPTAEALALRAVMQSIDVEGAKHHVHTWGKRAEFPGGYVRMNLRFPGYVQVTTDELKWTTMSLGEFEAMVRGRYSESNLGFYVIRCRYCKTALWGTDSMEESAEGGCCVPCEARMDEAQRVLEEQMDEAQRVLEERASRTLPDPGDTPMGQEDDWAGAQEEYS